MHPLEMSACVGGPPGHVRSGKWESADLGGAGTAILLGFQATCGQENLSSLIFAGQERQICSRVNLSNPIGGALKHYCLLDGIDMDLSSGVCAGPGPGFCSRENLSNRFGRGFLVCIQLQPDAALSLNLVGFNELRGKTAWAEPLHPSFSPVGLTPKSE